MTVVVAEQVRTSFYLVGAEMHTALALPPPLLGPAEWGSTPPGVLSELVELETVMPLKETRIPQALLDPPAAPPISPRTPGSPSNNRPPGLNVYTEGTN